MCKKDEENDLVNKVIDLILSYNIKESELRLEFLNHQVKMYQDEIKYLDNTRPFFFQKKKIQEHNLKLEECENKLFETYKKIEDEFDLIHKMQESINSN